MGRPSRFSPEVRERAVRMVEEHRDAHASEWAVLQSIAPHLVFLYLVNRRVPVDFRQFLLRHLGLLRMVHRWTLRLLVPRRFRKADRHARGAHVGDPDDPYLRREFTRQGSAKIQALYRAWRVRGDRVLWDAPSTVLADDRTHGCVRVEVVILAFAERILPRASDLWVQASLDYKQRLQALFFPEGIAYDGRRFNRTAVTAPLFGYLARSEGAEEKVVSREGIEPDPATSRN